MKTNKILNQREHQSGSGMRNPVRSEAKTIWSPVSDNTACVWNVGYRDPEYARLHGDPVLVRVVAFNKADAERVAFLAGYGNPAGLWAWRSVDSSAGIV